MSEFEAIIGRSYKPGEEAISEKVAIFEIEEERCYVTIGSLADRILAVVQYPTSVIEALRELADDIEEAYGGDGDEA